MTLTTDTISAVDFRGNPEWLALIAPYGLYHREPAGDTDRMKLPYGAEDVHAPTLFPGKKNTAFIKASPEGELLFKVPASLLSFLNNRRQHVQDGDTYGTIIEQNDIEILRGFVEGGTAPLPVVVPLSHEAEAFCIRERICPYVTLASDLLNQCFSNIQGIVSEILQDPDTEDQRLVIHVEVKGEIEAVLDMYDKYTEEWVSRSPWPERAKISLSYLMI